MKKLIFNELLEEAGELETASFSSIENFIESCTRGFLNIDVTLLSDITNFCNLDRNDTIEFENIKHLTNYIAYFVFNILINNAAVRQRKLSPYDINIIQKISFKERKFQLYLFLDDSIFGLCVGTKFKNVLAFIQSIFPIIAKTSFFNEVRFFPISRMDYILQEEVRDVEN